MSTARAPSIQYPPSPSPLALRVDPDARNQIDGSEAIFAMYLEISLREDKETVDGWNQDAKSILLFVGSPLLFRVHHLMIVERIIFCSSCGSLRAKLAGA